MQQPNGDSLTLLVYLNEAIAGVRTRPDLYAVMADKLRRLLKFDVVAMVMLEPDGQSTRLFLRSFHALPFPEEADWQLENVRMPVAGNPAEQFMRESVVQCLSLAALRTQYPGFAPFRALERVGMQCLTIAPLKLGPEWLGYLTLATQNPAPYGEDDLTLLELVAAQLSLAITHLKDLEAVRQQEQEKTLQLTLAHHLVSLTQRAALVHGIAEQINRVIPCAFFGLGLQGTAMESATFASLVRDPAGVFTPVDEAQLLESEELRRLDNQAFRLLQEPRLYLDEEFDHLCTRSPMAAALRAQFGARSALVVPVLATADSTAGLLLADRREFAFTDRDLALMSSLAPQIGLALENVLAFEQISTLKQQLEQEKVSLLAEMQTGEPGEMIGTSEVLLRVLRLIGQVAPTETTVLITGETGTGKELVARALHRRSPRHDQPFIKVNCAALPRELIESELFGHEKGSFTGAIERRIGKFELAQRGTIFLDEIGELPLDLQAKLLRVLQEKEIERVGGQRVVKVDVRVVAATNRLLEAEVAAGRFRADLYFRLAVFPVALPPLRERPEDIAPLMRHFLQRYARRMGKAIHTLASTDLQLLLSYAWPGNIRELEHVIEQAVILTNGGTLDLSRFGGRAALSVPAVPTFKPLQDMEREYILAVLHHTNGRVSGPQGAALILNVNPQTLESRLRKLGIKKELRAYSAE